MIRALRLLLAATTCWSAAAVGWAQPAAETQVAPIWAGSASLAVTTSSANVALPAAVNPYAGAGFTNDGPVNIFVALGGNSVTATTGSLVILPGHCRPVWLGPTAVNGNVAPTYVAAIAAAGKATLRIDQWSGLPSCGGAPLTAPSTGADTDCTLTLNGSTQTLVAANAAQKYIEFENTTAGPHPVAFSWTSASPSLNGVGFILDGVRGWSYTVGLPALETQALTVIGTSGDQLACHYQ